MSDIQYTDPAGVKWVPFIVEFVTQEGKFTFDLWAVDWAHAIDRLEELKSTASISGQKVGEVKR